MARASVFMNNKSQAIRLPKAMALPEGVKKVEIVKLGKALLITPEGMLWDSFFEGPSASADFMEDRKQPEMQKREAI